MRRRFCLLLCLVFALAVDAQTFEYRYWFDDNHEDVKTGTTGERLSLEVDVSGLSESLHAFHFQVIENDTLPSTIRTQYFVKTVAASSMKCYYALDDAEAFQLAGSFGEGAYSFDFDAAPLSLGLHRISYFFVTENGTVSSIRSSYFIRDLSPGEGIIRYDYSINDDEFTESVTLETPADTLRLTELQLPERLAKAEIKNFRIKAYDANGGEVEGSIETAPMPEFTYDGINTLKITSTEEDATILYRVEGYDDDWVPYVVPVALTDNRPVYAIVRAEGFGDSPEAVLFPIISIGSLSS